MNISDNKLGYVYAVLATIFWSGNFIVARNLNELVDPVSLSFYRWIVAVVFLLPFAIKPLIKNLNIIKKHFIYLSIVSILGVSLFNTLLYMGAQTSPAMNLSLISITFPIFVLIISRIFLKEYITMNKIFGIFFVLIGVLLLITKANVDILLNISFTIGDIWVLIAAISFAIYSILIKYKPIQFGMLDFQLTSFVIGTLYLIPFFLWEYDLRIFDNNDYSNFFSILYVGIFASLFAFIFWNKAIILIGASKAGLIYYTLPIFTGFLAYIFLKEEITYIHIISILFIFIGIFITNYTNKSQNKYK